MNALGPVVSPTMKNGLVKSRREVLMFIVAGTAIAACGGGSDMANGAAGGTGGAAAPNCLDDGTVAEVLLNHGHVLTVSVADINAGVDKTYNIQGSADHPHFVTLTAADFAALKQNMQTRENTTTNVSATFGTHSHAIDVACA
jgi:hypothetical protein